MNKLANIEIELDKLQKNEEEIVKKRIFVGKNVKLESIIAEKMQKFNILFKEWGK